MADGVDALGAEFGLFDTELAHFLIGDCDVFGVRSLVQSDGDAQAGWGEACGWTGGDVDKEWGMRGATKPERLRRCSRAWFWRELSSSVMRPIVNMR